MAMIGGNEFELPLCTVTRYFKNGIKLRFFPCERIYLITDEYIFVGQNVDITYSQLIGVRLNDSPHGKNNINHFFNVEGKQHSTLTIWLFSDSTQTQTCGRLGEITGLYWLVSWKFIHFYDFFYTTLLCLSTVLWCWMVPSVYGILCYTVWSIIFLPH